eukprot:gene7171-8550_t
MDVATPDPMGGMGMAGKATTPTGATGGGASGRTPRTTKEGSDAQEDRGPTLGEGPTGRMTPGGRNPDREGEQLQSEWEEEDEYRDQLEEDMRSTRQRANPRDDNLEEWGMLWEFEATHEGDSHPVTDDRPTQGGLPGEEPIERTPLEEAACLYYYITYTEIVTL